MDIPRYGIASGSVTAITIRNSAQRAWDEKNFHPLITHSSPSLTARVRKPPGIGTALGLGHGVARNDLALQKGGEILLLLLGGPVVRQDLCVSRVGRLGPEDPWCPL